MTDAKELVERLRDHARNVGGDPSCTRLYGREACEAADHIEQQAARIAELEAALAKLQAAISWIEPPFVDRWTIETEIRQRIGFCLADARAAITKETDV